MSLLDPAWAVETLIASTLLMGFVLAVRRPAQRALGPQLAYWLWALPALRMALPPLPASWRETTTAPFSAVGDTVVVLLQPVAAGAPDTVVAAVPWLLIIGGLWAVGAVGFFAWHSAAHLSYVRRIVSPPARHERLDDGTTLVESDEATGPVAFGVWRRFVAVPRDFAERWDEDERRLALSHELGHHARGDLIANWIALAVLALHWWNPLAWVAYRKFRGDQEMANDARVLAKLPAIERHAYACAIVKAAHGRAITAACHLHTIEDLKGRLRMLKASRKSARVIAAGAVGIGAMTVAGLGLTASSAAAERIRTVTTTQVAALTEQVANPAPAASATVAANPAPAASASPAARARRVIVSRDGDTHVYEGAEADKYMAQLPAPPLPPLPPLPPALPGVPVGVMAPVKVVVSGRPQGASVVTLRDGQQFTMVPTRFAMPRIITVDTCKLDGAGTSTRTETKDGQTTTIICRNTIERAAKLTASLSAMSGLRSALSSLKWGRMSIERDRNLSDSERSKALSELDRARTELEHQLAATAKD